VYLGIPQTLQLVQLLNFFWARCHVFIFPCPIYIVDLSVRRTLKHSPYTYTVLKNFSPHLYSTYFFSLNFHVCSAVRFLLRIRQLTISTCMLFGPGSSPEPPHLFHLQQDDTTLGCGLCHGFLSQVFVCRALNNSNPSTKINVSSLKGLRTESSSEVALFSDPKNFFHYNGR